jgi:hypothetical protein
MRFAAFVCLLLLPPAFAQTVQRNRAEVRAFRAENHCPATGMRRGSCPGYVVDHIDPLCNGGPDRRDNMQWQTVADAKRKDADERRLCRQLRRRP